MISYYHIITEKNKLTLNKPLDSDVIYYSELNEWFTRNAFRSFSLKYVVDRSIHYKVGSREHIVGANQFMLACPQTGVNAYFESKEKVKSICIDICPSTIAEAFTVLTNKADHQFDNYLAGYFKTPEFFESVNTVKVSQFSHKLTDLVAAIKENRVDEMVNKEWFLDLAEKIVYQEYGNYLALSGLRSVRVETRKEILRRLRAAREYMDESFLEVSGVGQVASVCNMSEFHFYRSFKQAFGCSPYQYLLAKRLELAKTLIAAKEMSITNVALHCNFPDIFTFSKAFKRHFKISPSVYMTTAAL